MKMRSKERKKRMFVPTGNRTPVPIFLHMPLDLGKTIFQYACMDGHFNIAKILIEKSNILNLNLNTKEKRNGETIFHMACNNGHLQIGKSLF